MVSSLEVFLLKCPGIVSLQAYLYAYEIFLMSANCASSSAHLILLDLITLVIPGEEYTL
jgi:hypothetical protein